MDRLGVRFAHAPSIGALALGVGANSAIFTVVIRPLPYANPDHLVRVMSDFT
jgi:hypothetical protein